MNETGMIIKYMFRKPKVGRRSEEGICTMDSPEVRCAGRYEETRKEKERGRERIGR